MGKVDIVTVLLFPSQHAIECKACSFSFKKDTGSDFSKTPSPLLNYLLNLAYCMSLQTGLSNASFDNFSFIFPE
jgi:hypothetical protein